ncbi:hypothetical protein EZS27_000871 [termite gut metagenome]|uniref:HEPN domain-containing protein n=1 Tax=termite gut metagenome TaxID=433724 RepID=A0A5J4SZR9_9ZZZZ
MSVLSEKSKENLESAQILHKQRKYNAATHCAYYSIFQIVMQIYNSENKPSGRGSHDVQIDFIKKDLCKKERFKFLEIKNVLSTMEELREIADYGKSKEEVIREEDSKNFGNDIPIYTNLFQNGMAHLL